MNAELLHTVAGWAGRTSLEATPLAIAALIFWRWMPVTWRWWLPALFFIRLAMPLVPESDWHWWTMSRPQPAPAAELSDAYAESVAPIPGPRTLSIEGAVKVLPMVWGGGVALVAVWLALSHWRLRRAIRIADADEGLQAHCDWAAARMSVARPVPIRVLRGLSTMAVCGAFRPELLIPHALTRRFTGAQIRGMMLHEMAHVRRRDVLWTWLALSLCAVHWFNPLAWIVLRRFHADRELACDAAALRALDQSARRDYGEALLLCLRSTPISHAPALVPFFRHFSELKQRLQHIMKPASPSIIARLAVSLAVPTLAVLTFTTARAQTRDGAASKVAEAAPAADRATLIRRLSLDLIGRAPTPEEVAAFEGDTSPDATRKLVDRLMAGSRTGGGPNTYTGTTTLDAGALQGGARDGEARKEGARDGERKKDGSRDGEPRKEGVRDGDARKKGDRDGEPRKEGPRDGEAKREGARDGDKRDGDKPREGDKPRDGAVSVSKTGTGVLILNDFKPEKAPAAETPKPRDGER